MGCHERRRVVINTENSRRRDVIVSLSPWADIDLSRSPEFRAARASGRLQDASP